jgi:hypothetical protein
MVTNQSSTSQNIFVLTGIYPRYFQLTCHDTLSRVHLLARSLRMQKVTDKKLHSSLKRKEAQNRGAATAAAHAELLNTVEAG